MNLIEVIYKVTCKSEILVCFFSLDFHNLFGNGCSDEHVDDWFGAQGIIYCGVLYL